LSEDFPGLAGFRAGSVLAGYRLEAQVGAGGMAVVFRARDQRLDRLVALKILAPALAADAAFRRRFIAESRAAAAVDDPHVIPVHEAGEADGVLFIAMRFVLGGDLRGVLEREGPLEPGRAAEFISPVASALDAAHGAGLVHRDIKPANILVDARAGRPDHVYLSDFGVSKGPVSSVSMTGTGQFLGTPHYSAPEQVQGRALDGRADQYALACVAFQLLTGQLPFERDQGMAVLLAHLSEPAPSLVERRPDLPAAAGQVLARALAKAPEERYSSCRDFADALREALSLPPYTTSGTPASGHPRTEVSVAPVISVQPVSPGPIAVAAGTAAGEADRSAEAQAATEDSFPVSAGALVPSAEAVSESGGLALESRGLTPQLDTLTAGAGRLAKTTDVRAAGPPAQRQRGRFLVIALACAIVAAAIAVPLLLAMPGARAHGTGSSPAAAKTPARTPPLSGPLTVTLAATLTDPSALGVKSVAFGPGGTTLAAGDGNGNTYLWDTKTGRITATLTNPGSSEVDSVALAQGGTTLAAGEYDSTTYVWDTTTRKITATLTDPGGQGVTSVAFAPDGTTLAAGDYNARTYLWDTTTGKLIATLTDPGGDAVNSVAFSPGGTTLAVGDDNDSTYLWDTTTGKLAATLTDPGGKAVNSVAFAPGGTTLAAGDDNGCTYLWNTTTGKLTASFTDSTSRGVSSVAFGPGGTTMAVGGENSSTYLWDTTNGKLIATLTPPSGVPLNAVAFAPGGATLAVSNNGGNTYLWRIRRA
jgi:serine/threonine protein kinase